MDELNQLFEALKNATAAADAGDKSAAEDAKKIASHIKEIQDKQKEEEEYVSPAIPTMVGAGIGGVKGFKDIVSPVVSNLTGAADKAMETTSTTPMGAKGVQNWVKSQTNAPYQGGSTMKKEWQKQVMGTEGLKSRGSNMPIRKGALSIQMQPEELTARAKALGAAKKIPGQTLGFVPKAAIAPNLVSGGIAGYNAANAYNQGVSVPGAISTAGTVAPALGAFSKNPKLKGAGLLVGGGSALLNNYLLNKQNAEEKATGGLVGYAKGKKVVKGGLEAVKKLVTPKEAEGYLHHTAINPNPLVGTRYETKDLGGLLPVKPISIEDLRGGMVNVNPWDLTSRNVQISGVSGKKLLNPVVTHGGQGYARDIAHQKEGIAGASGKEIASRVQNRANVAADEADYLGGSGRVYTLPSTMGVRSENFAFPTTELYYDLYKQADLPKSVIKQQSDFIRGIPGDKKTFPFSKMPDLDHPEVMDLFERNPEFRKAFLAQQQSKSGQKMLNINEEDVAAAMTDPYLRGVPRGYAGHTVIEMKPGADIIPSKNISYPYDTQGIYSGSLEHTPVPILLNRPYERIYQELKAKYPDKSDAAIRSMTIGALETRGKGVSELIDEEAINRIGQYHEGAKQGKFDPFDMKSGLEYIRQPGIYKEGGSTTPAWQRKEGKNPEGGLNAAGRASYNRETGGNLKPPVSAEQAKKSPKSAARRKSFCARMSGNKGPMKDENGKPTRKALALKKWDC